MGGADDGGGGVSTSVGPPITQQLYIPGDAGIGSVTDNLSSFSAKDPFKAQAVVTTTTATTTTIPPTTTTRSTTTTTSSTTTSTTVPSQTTTTTTVPAHYLQLNVILSGGSEPLVIYTLDGQQIWGQAVGGIYDTGSIKIEVLAIDTGAGTATFRRDDTYEFTLGVGEAENW
jgi:hypothetical protein